MLNYTPAEKTNTIVRVDIMNPNDPIMIFNHLDLNYLIDMLPELIRNLFLNGGPISVFEIIDDNVQQLAFIISYNVRLYWTSDNKPLIVTPTSTPCSEKLKYLYSDISRQINFISEGDGE